MTLNAAGIVEQTQKLSNDSGFPEDIELPLAGEFGSSIALMGDVNGDGISDLAVGASLDDDGPLEFEFNADRGAVWIVFLNDDLTVQGMSKISDGPDSIIRLDDNDKFGSALAIPGDINNDGVPDLVVGASDDDDGGTNRGALWVLFLDAGGRAQSYNRITDTIGGLSARIEEGDTFGQSVTAIGDLDGDGVTDLAVGAENDDDGGENYGAVWILFMNQDGTVKTHRKISALESTFTGAQELLDEDDKLGFSITNLNDLDKDGVEDIAVGAIFDDDGGGNSGAIWIFLLNRDGSIKSYQKISAEEGGFTGMLEEGYQFGHSVTSPGDLDGDDISDLVVGSPKDNDGGSNTGAVWFLFLNEDGTVKDHVKLSNLENAPEDFELSTNDEFGLSVEAIGDINDDGFQDIAVGAIGDDSGGIDGGGVWLLFLGENATVQSFKKIGGGEIGFDVELDQRDQFGSSIAALGDVNNDGIEDIAIGVEGDDDGGLPGDTGADYGAIWIINLTREGEVKAYSKISEESGENKFSGLINSKDAFGKSMAPIGDLNDDGIPDFAVGAVGDDDGGSRTGAVWIFFLNEPPLISMSSLDNIQEVEAATDLVISAAVSSRGGVDDAVLSYRRAGFSDFTSVLMNETESGVFSGNIPAFVTDGDSSIEFYITATDESGATGRSPEEGIFSVPIQIPSPGIETSYSAAEYYRLISNSIRSDDNAPSSILAELGLYDNTRWRLFELTPSIEPSEEDLIEGHDISAITPGKGYYIRSSEAFTSRTGAGITERTDTYFRIPLETGWQLIGNPFSFDIALDRVRLMSSGQVPRLQTLFNGGWVESEQLATYQGYAIFSDGPDTLFVAPNEFALDQILQEKLQSPSRTTTADWRIDIESVSTTSSDLDTRVQVFESEKEVVDTWDTYDHPEAPPIGDYVSLYFRHDNWDHPVKKYSVDARPIPKTREVWPLELVTSKPDKVTLTFNGIETVPEEFDVLLVDDLLQQSLNLRDENRYEVLTLENNRPRALSLVISPKEDTDSFLNEELPDQFEVYQNFPNPFSSWTTITYSLAEDTPVEVYVYNMLGQRVATLESVAMNKAGTYRVFWGGRSDSGAPLAGGIYIVRVHTSRHVLSKTITKIK